MIIDYETVLEHRVKYLEDKLKEQETYSKSLQAQYLESVDSLIVASKHIRTLVSRLDDLNTNITKSAIATIESGIEVLKHELEEEIA